MTRNIQWLIALNFYAIKLLKELGQIKMLKSKAENAFSQQYPEIQA